MHSIDLKCNLILNVICVIVMECYTLTMYVVTGVHSVMDVYMHAYLLSL